MRYKLLLAAWAISLAASPAWAGEGSVTLDWLPGAARAIPRTDSASRDAPTFEYAYGPAAYDTIGGEWGWFAASGPKVSFRLGQYAMLPMENHDSKKIFPPGQMWRGMTGGSISLSLDSASLAWFGDGGGFEISMAVGHESDHGSLPHPPRPDDIPLGGGGETITPDIAIRVPLADRFTMIVRLEDRIFMKGALVHAPGGDLILRYRLAEHIIPTLAVFAEGIFPRKDQARDGFFVRVLAGITAPGRIGEAMFFFGVDAGCGKGMLINHRELRLSGGVRYTPFTW